MRTKLLGLLTGIALVSGGAAFADDWQKKQQEQEQSQQGTGGAGTTTGESTEVQTETEAQTGTESQMGGTGGSGALGQSGQSELSGTVAKADRKTIYLKDQQGAIVPLKVDNTTKFADANVKSARDLKEGQQVRASFETKGTENIATQVWTESGMGGSGFEQQEQQPLPPEPGTGGSGEDTGINEPIYPEPNGPMTPPGPGTGGSGDVGTEEGIETEQEPGTMNPDLGTQGSEQGVGGSEQEQSDENVKGY
jgi:hypothetical protein